MCALSKYEFCAKMYLCILISEYIRNILHVEDEILHGDILSRSLCDIFPENFEFRRVRGWGLGNGRGRW